MGLGAFILLLVALCFLGSTLVHACVSERRNWIILVIAAMPSILMFSITEGDWTGYLVLMGLSITASIAGAWVGRGIWMIAKRLER